MEVYIKDIFGSTHDYKVCKECKTINWYENTNCFNCGSKHYNKREQAVLKAIQKEFDFYVNECGFTDMGADNTLIEV